MVKDWKFPKGLAYGFWRKLQILKLVPFQKTRLVKVFGDVLLEQNKSKKCFGYVWYSKQAILDEKNVDLL